MADHADAAASGQDAVPTLLGTILNGVEELRKHLSLNKSVDQTAALEDKKAKRVAREAAAARRLKSTGGNAIFTAAEVATHSTPDDAWMIIDGKVYDVTDFDHPGGDVILSYAGLDATEVFEAMHPTIAPRVHMKRLLVGTLDTSSARSVDSQDSSNQNMLEDFSRLKHQLSQAGLMTARKPYYARKLAELVAMAAGGIWLLMSGAAAAHGAAWWAATVLLGMCVAQSGWLGHDLCHLQVFRKSSHNNLMGIMVLALGMGGSAHWWKNKHNRHHATPNRLDSDTKVCVDPDIDTIPLIAWDDALARQVPPGSRGLIRIQHWLLWPVLTVAYANWLQQSTAHMLTCPMPRGRRVLEAALVSVHHAGLAAAVFACLPLGSAATMYAVLHGIAGFVLAFVFVQSHNGMEVYDDDKDFVTAQLVSTRNILPGLLTDWFFGGLNYQIEHHLFPNMPRHSLAAARPLVKAFAARHGLVYEECGLLESNRRVFNRLKAVSRLATAKL